MVTVLKNKPPALCRIRAGPAVAQPSPIPSVCTLCTPSLFQPVRAPTSVIATAVPTTVRPGYTPSCHFRTPTGELGHPGKDVAEGVHSCDCGEMNSGLVDASWSEMSHKDPAYRQVSRALIGSIVLSAGFCLYIFFAKETPSLYVHEPWQDDPYDALISFEFVVLPVLTVLCACRFLLSARDAAVPGRRIVDLVRGCYLLNGIVAVTVAAEWLSVFLGTHPADRSPVTAGVLAVLAAFSAANLLILILLAVAFKRIRGRGPSAGQPDWLADGLLFLELIAGAFGPLGKPMRVVTDWANRAATRWIRRYPLSFLAIVSVVLAILGGAVQIIREGYGPEFATYFLTVNGASYYAFFAIANGYLGLIAAAPIAHHPGRLAVITTTASIPLVTAFRQFLGGIVGATENNTTAAQLYLLTALVAAATAAVTVVISLIVRRLAPSQRP